MDADSRDGCNGTASASRSPRIALSANPQDPRLFLLHIWNHDQAGFLFRLCELLTKHSIEISGAEIAPKDNMMEAKIRLRVASDSTPTSTKGRVERCCREIEEFVGRCEKEDPPNPEDPQTLERLSVNPDLLSVSAFNDVTEEGSGEELKYHLEVSCINQVGLLAYLALVFFRSGFNIMSVRCAAPPGECAWLSFDLTTTSMKAERVVRTYLDIPYERRRTHWDDQGLKRSSSEESRRTDSKSLCSSADCWPPGKTASRDSGANENGAMGEGVSYKVIPLPNGDFYEGGCKATQGGQKQHGVGTYVYNAANHDTNKQYKGHWREGKKHGHGVLCYQNGSVYVGQWQDNHRHGLGVMFECPTAPSDTFSMPSYSYEGEWRNDERHGLGAEETADSFFYGNFTAGKRDGKGVQVMIGEHNRVTGCEVLDGKNWYPLLDMLELGIDILEQDGAMPSVSSLPVFPVANSLTEGGIAGLTNALIATSAVEDEMLVSTAASENGSAASTANSSRTPHLEPLPVLSETGPPQSCNLKSELSAGDGIAASQKKFTLFGHARASPMGGYGLGRPSPSNAFMPLPSPCSFGRVSAPSPVVQRCLHLEPQPSPHHNGSWLGSPRLAQFSPNSAIRAGIPGSASPKRSSVAWMASPGQKSRGESVRRGLSAPASPYEQDRESRSAPVSPAGSECGDDVEMDLIIEESAPAPYASPGTVPIRKNSTEGPSTPRATSPAYRIESIKEESRSVPASPNSPKESLQRSPLKAKRRRSPTDRKTKRPVMGPMLWSEDELAAFLSCIGLRIAIAKNVRSCNLKGVAQLLHMSNNELCQRFGFSSPVEWVVMRKALKRFLELDRWENAVRGRKITDSTDDPNLRDFIIPAKELNVESEISQGGFGHVFTGTLCSRCDRGKLKACNKHKVAVKEMKGDRNIQLHELLKESRVMASLRHKHICMFIGICADLQHRGKSQYIVSELMDCSLFDLLHCPHKHSWTGELTIPAVMALSEGICSGIMFLHGRRLVHADLKSSNILIDYQSSSRPLPKICDFGHVAMRTHPAPHHRCGTPHWAAPEALRQEAVGPAADVFSCGVMLWEMLAGSPPHRHLTSFAQICGAVGWAGELPDMDALPELPKELQDLMLSCLAFSAEMRPKAEDLRLQLRRLRKTTQAEALQLLKGFIHGLEP